MPTELPRVMVTLTPSEHDELARHAAARGLRPAEAARGAVVAMLRDPAAQAGEGQGATPSDPASLAAAATALARTADTLARLLPAAEATARTEEYVRGALREIAEHVGTVAGAVVPLDPGPDEDAFGLRAGPR